MSFHSPDYFVKVHSFLLPTLARRARVGGEASWPRFSPAVEAMLAIACFPPRQTYALHHTVQGYLLLALLRGFAPLPLFDMTPITLLERMVPEPPKG